MYLLEGPVGVLLQVCPGSRRSLRLESVWRDLVYGERVSQGPEITNWRKAITYGVRATDIRTKLYLCMRASVITSFSLGNHSLSPLAPGLTGPAILSLLEKDPELLGYPRSVVAAIAMAQASEASMVKLDDGIAIWSWFRWRVFRSGDYQYVNYEEGIIHIDSSDGVIGFRVADEDRDAVIGCLLEERV